MCLCELLEDQGSGCVSQGVPDRCSISAGKEQRLQAVCLLGRGSRQEVLFVAVGKLQEESTDVLQEESREIDTLFSLPWRL